uniref:glycine rich domain-containing protein n=1 Tax=Odoribacter lunatus TaxID=2941335 RepID=UPI0020422BFD
LTLSYTTFHYFYFKRRAICAVGVAETSYVTIVLAPSPFASSVETLTNKYPSFTVDSRWGTMQQTHWTLDTPPTGISISDKGLVTGLTFNSVFWTNVTVSSDKCPGQEWTKRLEVRREFAYTGSYQSITLAPGKYKMECYGAEGGQSRSNGTLKGYGGLGGYSCGNLQLASPTTFYIYIGGRGGDGTKSKTGGTGGWNGGGNGGTDEGDDTGGGGGGASDIRLVAGNLYSRIMVAGGGGGAREAGNGGGVNGGNPASVATTYVRATQTGYTFGVGGNGLHGGNNNYGGGGGGGGYYGPSTNKKSSGGGGGSGFVSGMSGCNAITGDGNLTPTGQPNHYSGFVFQNASMSSGVQSGNGKVRISPLN